MRTLGPGSICLVSPLTRAPAGAWANFAPTGGGGGGWPPPRRSRKLSNVARSGKRRSKAWEKVYRKYFSNFSLRAKMTSLEVTKCQISPWSDWGRYSPTNIDVARELQGLGGRGKTCDSSFTDLFVVCSQIWPRVNGLAPRGHDRSKWPIFEDFVFLS